MGAGPYAATAGIALVVGMLAGTQISLGPGQSQAFYCPSSGKVGVFDSVAGMKATWTDSSGKHTISCKGQAWQLLQPKDNSQGNESVSGQNQAGTFLCGLEGCQEVKQ